MGPSKVPIQAGFAAPEALIGLAVSSLVIISALTLSAEMTRLGHRVADRAQKLGGARWALARMEREVRRAGLGVAHATIPENPDEGIELLTPGAFGVRGDLDRDDPVLAADPETDLAGLYPSVATANDEVVVFLRRDSQGGGEERAEFQADMDGSDRVTRSDGTLLARRDGNVEWIDAGPYAAPGDGGSGTLYRVTFVDNATYFGSGRFRVVEPLADGITDFQVRGLDEQGAEVGPCGGGDDSAARNCRGAIRQIEILLEVQGGHGNRERIVRRWALLPECRP